MIQILKVHKTKQASLFYVVLLTASDVFMHHGEAMFSFVQLTNCSSAQEHDALRALFKNSKLIVDNGKFEAYCSNHLVALFLDPIL